MNNNTLSGVQLQDKIAEQLANTSFAGTASIQDVSQETRIGDKQADITAIITTVSGVQIPLVITVKNTQRLSNVREMIRQIKQLAQPAQAEPMIAGVFWGERARKLAKEERVGLVDLAGNFLIQKDPVFIERVVNKNPFSKTSPLKSLFSPVSTRIIRAVLIEPKRVWDLQELSKETSVSIGQTYKVVYRLEAEEFGKRNKAKQFVLTSPLELLDEWKNNYSIKQNKKYSFYSFERDYANRLRKIAEQGSEQNLQYAISFFTGTDLIAPFIRGIVKTQFYIANEGDLKAWQQALELKPVESGANVEMYIPYDEGVFYKPQEIGIGGEVSLLEVVNNIQLYLDVVNSPARGAEQAQYLLENKLLPEFKT